MNCNVELNIWMSLDYFVFNLNSLQWNKKDIIISSGAFYKLLLSCVEAAYPPQNLDNCALKNTSSKYEPFTWIGFMVSCLYNLNYVLAKRYCCQYFHKRLNKDWNVIPQEEQDN